MKNTTTLLLALALSSMTVFAADGATLYKKCASCHGLSGEKEALGKSKIINAMSKPDLITALNGYKDGSYGGSMKALMKGQVAPLSDNDIDVLAHHISNLKQ